MKPEINYKKKTGKFTNMEIKQHATEQPMRQRRNQKGNLKKYLQGLPWWRSG